MRLSSDMTTARQAYLALQSHPSLAASMDDFEAREFSPTVPDMPSQHSGFRSNNHSEYSEDSRSYSPPAWRKNGSGWFQHQQALSPHPHLSYSSKEPSPQYHSADEDVDLTAYRAARSIPLPESPLKGRSPSNSPEPDDVLEGAAADAHAHAYSPSREASAGRDAHEPEPASPVEDSPPQSNYIRFSTSLDVMQRTEPIEATVIMFRKAYHHIVKSRYNTLLYTASLLAAVSIWINILSPPMDGAAPDLLKVAGLAKSFEPMIYYSESGNTHIEQLQETGVAVWDLSESVRSTNMTSAPIIVGQLDELSDSLKTLALELTSFFTSVDSDIDSILLVMEWSQRELGAVSAKPPSTAASIWTNTHNILTSTGIISPTSDFAERLLGLTYQQRTKSALERAFHEFLGVLEETINNELTHSIRLFALFEAIDKQFLNLQRSVIREQDTQERIESEFLSSLWTKVIGVNASKLRKYEKNKGLLRTVRDRTVRNKHVLLDHNQRLITLKTNLETLRRKLVSPLVQSAANSSSLTIEAQIKGLDATYQQLKDSRDVQKRKVMEMNFGVHARRPHLLVTGDERAIEDRPWS